MSDPHEREPVDQATIDGWRINYGLDKRTPAEAAQWWSDKLGGLAPAGAVAALGVALDELAEWHKLRDPVNLHVNLLRGMPCKLTTQALLHIIGGAPVAIMDTRDALGLCAPSEEDFPALYALQGRRVALVDLGPNVRANRPSGAARSDDD